MVVMLDGEALVQVEVLLDERLDHQHVLLVRVAAHLQVARERVDEHELGQLDLASEMLHAVVAVVVAVSGDGGGGVARGLEEQQMTARGQLEVAGLEVAHEELNFELEQRRRRRR